MKRKRTLDRIIGWGSGFAFCVLFVSVASRVGPLSMYWVIAAIVLAGLSAALVSIGVERSVGAFRSFLERRRHDQ